MELKGSLPHTLVPDNFPYPEPAQSSPCLTSHFLKTHLIIIFHLFLGLPSGFIPSGFPTKTLYQASPLTNTRYMSRPSHSSRFYHSKNIGWGVEVIKLINIHSPVTSSLLGPNILLSTLFSNTLSLRSSTSVSDQVSYPYKTTGKI